MGPNPFIRPNAMPLIGQVLQRRRGADLVRQSEGFFSPAGAALRPTCGQQDHGHGSRLAGRHEKSLLNRSGITSFGIMGMDMPVRRVEPAGHIVEQHSVVAARQG